MNLLRIYGATLIVALTMGMSACKNEESPATTPAASEVASSGQKISFDVEIEGLPSDEVRLLLQENIVNNKHTGLKFAWNVGDKEKLYLAFKQESGSSQSASGRMAVRESSLTILAKEGNHYKARVDVTAPNGFDPAAANVVVAGAIGVKGIDATTGRASIPGPRYFYDAGETYTLPMYFAPTRLRTKVENGQRGYYADNLTFRFYGAVVGATIDNTQGNMLYSPHEITMKTGALTTEGEINLFNFETDANNQSVPKWTTTQDANTTQRVYFEQGDVAVGKKRTYYFWAVPTKFEGRREMTMEFRTDAHDEKLGETADDISTKWRVKQLAMGKVHRFQTAIPAPKGELIISEVFIGDDEYATAWEFYNPTNQAVDLSDYSLQRYDQRSNGSYPSSPDFTTPLIPELGINTIHVDNVNNSAGGKTLKSSKLGPHKTVVYLSTKVMLFLSKARFQARKGLAYIIGFGGGQTPYDARSTWPKAFHSKRTTRYLLVKNEKGATVPVDAFFWYEDGSPARYPTATFMRKPGRDLPRPRMQLKSNSDWIMRERKEGLDWGFRFGYYYDGERLSGFAHGAHWLDDQTIGANPPIDNNKNGYLKERPLFAPDFTTGEMDFTQLKGQSKTRPYTPPKWWTKERAEAADR
ncbi:lamin tail domain-containing protein [Porphyromonas bobii]|jgi:lipoprotein|uniref:lamin tail domain-containing protein n=1 Tax=Porphyromonas bobii TaxID=2811780 RepID=UPI001C002955|nr:lamin tail domain-containing protein [Porphyromonas bobii]